MGEKLKNRYKNINDVNIGDKIMYDNNHHFIKSLPNKTLIGEVSEIIDEKLVQVDFKVDGKLVQEQLNFLLLK